MPRHSRKMSSIHYHHRGTLLQADWEAWARHLIEEGRFFSAYERAQQGLQQFPESVVLKQIKARALMRTGGIEEAKKILEPLLPPILSGQEIRRRLTETLRQQGQPEPPDRPGTQSFLEAAAATLQELLTTWQGQPYQSAGANEETIGLLGRIYKDLWKRSGDLTLAQQSREIYAHGYRTTGGYWTGINAATMAWITGDKTAARDLAAQVSASCQGQLDGAREESTYWLYATLGEAQLLLGNLPAAGQAYAAAARQVHGNYDQIVSSRQQLRLLRQHGLEIPDDIFAVLKPPTIVICAGHLLDQPGSSPPRFPASLEAAVRAALDRELEALDARIGFSGAASGADLLFLEAMADREGRVNIILPFGIEDYLKTSVAAAGPRWVARFRKALKLADSVRYVTEEKYLGDNLLFRFTSQIINGYALLHGLLLDTEPYLLAVWDGTQSGRVGGTAEMVSHWVDPARLRIIDTAALLGHAGAVTEIQVGAVVPEPPEPAPARHPAARTRVIKTLLFADIQQFSKIAEENLPFYMYEFLERVSRQLPLSPKIINTWGDGIFVAMDEALPLVEYAFALRDVVVQTDWSEVGLPAAMNIRIALHAGPVFQGLDALTERDNVYGSHVNRAARLEPKTPPGEIYGSEQFAALLLMEQATHSGQDGLQDRNYAYFCDYAGIVHLPKDFGVQAVFHIRKMSAHEMQYQ